MGRSIPKIGGIPGSAPSARPCLGVEPGSIVVMHDNVETEGQTVQAPPSIIEGLKERGYHLVTITQLRAGTRRSSRKAPPSGWFERTRSIDG